ncbi:MAG TPA: glycoside hydrolase family 172 protein [Dehalococcoidia bacterium]|nr:glycoside hydrolase family 172 protein [Dehalococcoidia bacterium]
MDLFGDITRVDLGVESRAITFENPTGARGAGGQSHGGRKGAPNRFLRPGETVTLAEIEGPATIRHIWMTFPPAPPEVMRALSLEVFYDGQPQPSISVPALDFFGMPLGRPVEFASILGASQEGRGFNSYVPMPIRASARLELTSHSDQVMSFYYQIDYTLDGPAAAAERSANGGTGLLHVGWRRENPTTIREDFTIVEGLVGPGRFLGCNLGIRVLDAGDWYGEGEVKIFLDGDTTHPTICGTGLEDYVGSAWGMGPHAAPYAGSPLEVRASESESQPDFLSFYRWHLLDPIVFQEELRVTIQQIGAVAFAAGREEAFDAYAETHPAAGRGWLMQPSSALHAWGIAERVDDYCATSFVYCETAQAVPRLDFHEALVDIERRPYEEPSRSEQRLGALMSRD